MIVNLTLPVLLQGELARILLDTIETKNHLDIDNVLCRIKMKRE